MPKIDVMKKIIENGRNGKEILESFQEANLTSDDLKSITETNNGWSPIHIVMQFGEGEGVLELVKYLVNLHPDCVKVKTKEGFLPIHVLPDVSIRFDRPRPPRDEKKRIQKDQLEDLLRLLFR